MFIDKITSDSSLPPGVAMAVTFLSLGKETDTGIVVKHIKSSKKAKRRLYSLLYVHEHQGLSSVQKGEIFKHFIEEEYEPLKYHMTLFSGLYLINENISKLHNFSINSNSELVRCTSIWSLSKLGEYESLMERISKELPIAKEDESTALLAASLYLINTDKNSQEMLLLKDYFLDNFYDEEKQQFYDTVIQSIDFSPELMAFLLWQVGYEFVDIKNWNSLNLDWLISKV